MKLDKLKLMMGGLAEITAIGMVVLFPYLLIVLYACGIIMALAAFFDIVSFVIFFESALIDLVPLWLAVACYVVLFLLLVVLNQMLAKSLFATLEKYGIKRNERKARELKVKLARQRLSERGGYREERKV